MSQNNLKPTTNQKPSVPIIIFAVLFVGLGAGLIWKVVNSNWEDLGQSALPLWMAGAGALGLVSGFTTGLSGAAGSGKAFMTFVGTGLLVPILGGVAALLGQTEKVTEQSTYNSEGQLVEKITETLTTLSDSVLHPLAVLGSFFLMFGILAILGIAGGMLLKKSGLSLALYQ